MNTRTEQPLRLAVIGCGVISRLHAEVAARSPDLERDGLLTRTVYATVPPRGSTIAALPGLAGISQAWTAWILAPVRSAWRSAHRSASTEDAEPSTPTTMRSQPSSDPPMSTPR